MSTESGERQLVQWLSRMPATRDPRVRLGIGDDMAVLDSGGRCVLMSSDMLLDGVHFDRTMQTLDAIGYKAIGCCLSDCAAMAVRPIGVTVSLGLPGDWTLEDSKSLYGGMGRACDGHGCTIVGGDTTAWDGRLAIDVAMVAECFPGVAPVRRSGGRVGDRLVVTGRLGGSILGRHMTFPPRVAEARRIVEVLGERVHAMMDISDGLALDLHRLCGASGVGARVSESQLTQVVHDDARELARMDGMPALDHALTDGEDFELLIAIQYDGDVATAVPGVPLWAIGEMVETGLTMVHVDGHEAPLGRRGFEHLR
ncbi:MAG: thiamine-phosphate kinase [Phycisphaerales bacterium]|nr:thiamine-phosphate kinase [Phycisphaerales bacterium]